MHSPTQSSKALRLLKMRRQMISGKHFFPISSLGRILYFIHRGPFYLLLIFKRKKKGMKKNYKIHYVRALESNGENSLGYRLLRIHGLKRSRKSSLVEKTIHF